MVVQVIGCRDYNSGTSPTKFSLFPVRIALRPRRVRPNVNLSIHLDLSLYRVFYLLATNDMALLASPAQSRTGKCYSIVESG